MFSTTYNVVCVSNYSVPPNLLILTHPERAGLTCLLKRILMSNVNNELSADLFFPVRMVLKLFTESLTRCPVIG